MRTISTIIWRLLLAVLFVIVGLGAIVLWPVSEWWENVEHLLVFGTSGMLIWDEFSRVPRRWFTTAFAVMLTFVAVTPEYSLWTAITGILAGIYVAATVVLWYVHRVIMPALEAEDAEHEARLAYSTSTPLK